MRVIGFIMCSLFLMACSPHATTRPAIVSEGQDVDAIRKAEQDLQTALTAKNIDAAGRFYAQTTLIDASGSKHTREIVQDLQRIANDSNGVLRFDASAIIQAAPTEGLAYSSGAYVENHTGAQNGAISVTSGNFLRVWRRQDNHWAVVNESRTPFLTSVRDAAGDDETPPPAGQP